MSITAITVLTGICYRNTVMIYDGAPCKNNTRNIRPVHHPRPRIVSNYDTDYRIVKKGTSRNVREKERGLVRARAHATRAMMLPGAGIHGYKSIDRS